MSDLERRLESALCFVRLLPASTAAPDSCFDDDGDISFEWYAGKDAQISVSVGPGYINWAAVLDGQRPHGYDTLEDVSHPVLSIIAAICSRKRNLPSTP